MCSGMFLGNAAPESSASRWAQVFRAPLYPLASDPGGAVAGGRQEHGGEARKRGACGGRNGQTEDAGLRQFWRLIKTYTNELVKLVNLND